MLATQFMNMIHAFSFYVILLGQKEKKKRMKQLNYSGLHK